MVKEASSGSFGAATRAVLPSSSHEMKTDPAVNSDAKIPQIRECCDKHRRRDKDSLNKKCTKCGSQNVFRKLSNDG